MKLQPLDDRPKGFLLVMSTSGGPNNFSDTILRGEDGSEFLKRHKLRMGIEPPYLCEWFRIVKD